MMLLQYLYSIFYKCNTSLLLIPNFLKIDPPIRQFYRQSTKDYAQNLTFVKQFLLKF